jgi:pimeloyl-ACP methyl ester carboxylesterase
MNSGLPGKRSVETVAPTFDGHTGFCTRLVRLTNTRHANSAAGPALIGPGACNFRYVDDRSSTEKVLTVWYYCPLHISAAIAPIVFVMHGVKRDAHYYRDNWRDAAERFGFLLLCPEFAKPDYPFVAYQLGNLVDGAGEPLPEEEWTLGLIERLFDFVREATGNPSEQYRIYGHSAGAQFVHRLALFVPEARFATAIAANAGWYTMPTFDGEKFPYGLKKSGSTLERLKSALGKHLVILLGEQDIDADDPHLRKSEGARRQGINRFERGLTFYTTARDEAAELGMMSNWELVTVPGAAHLDPQMIPAAARELFRSPRTSEGRAS